MKPHITTNTWLFFLLCFSTLIIKCNSQESTPPASSSSYFSPPSSPSSSSHTAMELTDVSLQVELDKSINTTTLIFAKVCVINLFVLNDFIINLLKI